MYEKLILYSPFSYRLFPIRESGMNWHAQELQPHEAKVGVLQSASWLMKGLRLSFGNDIKFIAICTVYTINLESLGACLDVVKHKRKVISLR